MSHSLAFDKFVYPYHWLRLLLIISKNCTSIKHALCPLAYAHSQILSTQSLNCKENKEKIEGLVSCAHCNTLPRDHGSRGQGLLLLPAKKPDRMMATANQKVLCVTQRRIQFHTKTGFSAPPRLCLTTTIDSLCRRNWSEPQLWQKKLVE